MQPCTRPPAPLDWGLLACLGVIWGGAFLGVELALDSLAPIWVSTGRITLAAIGLVALAQLSGAGLPPARTATGRRIWLHCIGMGLFTNAIPLTPGGIGVGEGVLGQLFAWAGGTHAEGVSLMLLYRVLFYACAMVGAVVYVAYKRGAPVQLADPSACDDTP